MPNRNDIKTILVLGSGPTVIGLSGGYDCFVYEACDALRSLGYRIVLVNSNPSALSVEPGVADVTYLEPLDAETVIKIIEKEKPEAILPGAGGQTALKLLVNLESCGALDKYRIKVMGFSPETVRLCENYGSFKTAMDALNMEVPRGKVAFSIPEAESAATETGYPVMVRPSYTIGGAGSSVCYNVEELRTTAGRGIAAGMNEQVIIAESLEGWGKIELEIIRDSANHMITACITEYIDAMGVNPEDSISVIPAITTEPDFLNKLQGSSFKIMEKLDITGNAVIQFAYDRPNGRTLVISVRPGMSGSSAAASIATGLPTSLISTKLAVGLLLRGIPYNKSTLDKYVQPDTSISVIMPTFDFEKMGAKNSLGTQMHATGAVIGVGKNFKEALWKAVRSTGSRGLGFAGDYNNKSLEELMELLKYPTGDRLFIVYEALRKGADIRQLSNKTNIKLWFLEQLKEPSVIKEPITNGVLRNWAAITGVDGNRRFCYSICNGSDNNRNNSVSQKPRVMILGTGSNAIGNSSSYEYGTIKTVTAANKMGYETITVNCNPAAFSTHGEIPGKVYIEPLNLENIINIYEFEKPIGIIIPPGNYGLAIALEKAGVSILGTPVNMLGTVSDRLALMCFLKENKYFVPEMDSATNTEEALDAVKRIGYPLIVSYTGAEGTRPEVVHNEDELLSRLNLTRLTSDRPITLERYLENAIGVEVNAISDGEEVFIPAIIEHIEHTGIHPGDAACIIPPVNLSVGQMNAINDHTRRISRLLNIIGSVNIQYGIVSDIIYVMDIRPGISLTMPLVSRVCNIPAVEIAVQVVLGRRLKEIQPVKRSPLYFGVKEAVFPFNMFPDIDPVLGVEMKSTGEALGLADSFGLAYWKAQESVTPLPEAGTILVTVTKQDRPAAAEVAKHFVELGFTIRATAGTRAYLINEGILTEPILKEHEGRPNITDAIKNKEIQLVINTPAGRFSKFDDSYIRKSAIKYGIPYVTTITAAAAAVAGIAAFRQGGMQVKSLQEYYKNNQ